MILISKANVYKETKGDEGKEVIEMYKKYVDAIEANKDNPKSLNELFEEIAYDDSITNAEYCKLVELAIDCCRSEGIRVYPVI